MRRAPVYRWTLDAQGHRVPLRIGELTQETTRWEFLYDKNYLALGPHAWELDPSEIRLKQRGAFTRVGVVPFPLFCDVALSGWSLATLQKEKEQLLGKEAGNEPWGWWERLLYAPADGFGAIFVGELEAKPRADEILADALGKVTRETLAQVELESSSGAMGGERPKITATVRGHGQDKAVLLKFPLPTERADTVVAEATALTLATELGMTVPAHEVVRLGDVAALQVQRFDRGPGAAMSSQALHCVSAATALGIQPATDVEDPKRSYVSLRSKLKIPRDAHELFRRIVLNAAVGNTDDHPWNTSLRQVGLSTWELSPLYDVQPFFARAPVPAFRMAILRDGTRTGTRANLIAAGRQIAGCKREEEAATVVDEVFTHVRTRWRAVFEHHAQALVAAPDDWVAVFEPPALA